MPVELIGFEYDNSMLVHQPFPVSLTDPISKVIHKPTIWLTNESVIVFLCGKAIPIENSGIRTARQNVIDYLRKHFSAFNYFLAEDVIKGLKNDHRDLLSVEHELAETSDCIIILLESAGACAELGAFAMNDEIATKLMVVNDINYKDEISFINVGPIAKANKKSKYGSVIYTDLSVINLKSNEIGKRIEDVNKQKYRRMLISDSDTQDFDKWSKKDQLLFLHDLVWFFYPISKANLISVFKNIFESSKTRINTLVELLCAMKLIVSQDECLISTSPEKLFFIYANKHVSIRAAILNYYHRNKKYFQSELDILKVHHG